jgi:hypothetical protein
MRRSVAKTADVDMHNVNADAAIPANAAFMVSSLFGRGQAAFAD